MPGLRSYRRAHPSDANEPEFRPHEPKSERPRRASHAAHSIVHKRFPPRHERIPVHGHTRTRAAGHHHRAGSTRRTRAPTAGLRNEPNPDRPRRRSRATPSISTRTISAPGTNEPKAPRRHLRNEPNPDRPRGSRAMPSISTRTISTPDTNEPKAHRRNPRNEPKPLHPDRKTNPVLCGCGMRGGTHPRHPPPGCKTNPSPRPRRPPSLRSGFRLAAAPGPPSRRLPQDGYPTLNAGLDALAWPAGSARRPAGSQCSRLGVMPGWSSDARPTHAIHRMPQMMIDRRP